MGFGIARIYKTKLSSCALKIAIVASVIAVVGIMIYSYSTGVWRKFSGFMVVPWCQYIIGGTLFVILYYFKTNVVADNWSCRFISRNSYEIYLTHPFIIFGSLSVIRLTESIVINIGLVIVITLAASTFIILQAN